jgi:hypothetical protein
MWRVHIEGHQVMAYALVLSRALTSLPLSQIYNPPLPCLVGALGGRAPASKRRPFQPAPTGPAPRKKTEVASVTRKAG